MLFKIRTKLLIAFFGIIFPFLIIVGIIAVYNMNIIRNAVLKAETISKEMHPIMSLQLAIHMALMPGNNYIITGDKRYIDEFNTVSKDVETYIEKLEDILDKLRKMEVSEVKEKSAIVNDVKIAWQNIKEISSKIFAIQNPIGNKNAARLVEEMNYKWAYPAIEKLDKHHEIHRKEHEEAIEGVRRAWRLSWAIMIAGAVFVIAIGASFAAFYSRLFTMPIRAIHKRMDAIAKGDFKGTLNIKTGDELQELSDAINEMAAQLDSFTSNLQVMVDKRTKDLKVSEERFRVIAETAADAIICTKAPDTIYLWNKKAEEMFGYAADDAVGMRLHDLIAHERYREEAREGVKVFFETGEGTVVGKTIEIEGLRKDGTEFPIELSVSAVRVGSEWHSVGIIRDITERKKVEEKIKEQVDYLERFQKVAVSRELRMKEIKDENEKLNKRIEEMEGELKKVIKFRSM